MYKNFGHLSDTAVMSLHRHFTVIKAEPWGYKKFPNIGERLALLDEQIMLRIPASHLWEIEQLQRDNNIAL